MEATYGERDAGRGGQRRWRGWPRSLVNWPRQCARARPTQQLHELGDVLAWLASLANQLGLSLEDGGGRYSAGCPTCGSAALRLPA